MVASKQHAPARLLISENLKNQRDGAPGEIRTPDLLVRSQTLYPTELRARNAWHVYQGDDDFSKSLKNQDLLSLEDYRNGGEQIACRSRGAHPTIPFAGFEESPARDGGRWAFARGRAEKASS
jgi:hypothetical protein